MEFRWKRRGLLIRPEGQSDWWVSHAQSGTPLILSSRRWRLFFAGRDGGGQSRIMYIDVDPRAEMRVHETRFDPILDLGLPGTFDSAGQLPSTALQRGERIDLYYIGAHLRRDVDYGLAIGLASGAESGQFGRRVRGPVLSTGPHDPYFVTSLFVAEDGNQFVGWYASAVGWISIEAGRLDPTYDLKRATSPDGIFWKTSPTGGLALQDGIGGYARPWVANIGGEEILFYSKRGFRRFREAGGETYRLWWVRLKSGFPNGAAAPVVFENPARPGDWDYEMQEYASVVPLDSGYVMFYNGNGFGRSGFGWATLGL